jgi:hypothetical protein
MEQKNVKIFYKPVDGGKLKELECVAESNGFEFEPLKEPIDVKYDPTPVTNTLSFDIDSAKCNIRKLFYTRIPRKKKKMAKKWLARLRGDIYCYIKRLRYDYMGTFYWIK